MQTAKMPPTRKSISASGTEQSSGLNQCLMCSALLHALNTRLRGTAKWREITSGSGFRDAISDFISDVRAIAASFLVLEGFEVVAQPIEPVFPFGSAGIDPLFDETQRARLDAARPDAA